MNLFPEIISVNLKLRYSWWKQLSSCAMLFLGGEENVFIYHFYNHQFTDLGNHLCGDCVSVYFIGKGFKKIFKNKASSGRKTESMSDSWRDDQRKSNPM